MEPELPEPSAELVLIRVMLEAHLDGLTPKERARFIARVNAGFEERLGLGNIRPLRPPSQFAPLLAAQKQAFSWWSKAMSARLMKVS